MKKRDQAPGDHLPPCSERNNEAFQRMRGDYFEDRLDQAGAEFVMGHILGCPCCREDWEMRRILEETPQGVLEVATDIPEQPYPRQDTAERSPLQENPVLRFLSWLSHGLRR